MKKRSTRSVKRNRELGAVAILVAVMWTALFGMAVLAVDFGYLYTKRRGVQAVTDAAVRSAMPTYMSATSNGFSQASQLARNIATANGYTDGTSDGTQVRFDEPTTDNFRMRITRTYPTFFGSLFGLASKQVSGSTTGRVVRGASSAGAILALGGAGIGIRISGDTTLTINGDVQSNGPLEMCGGPARPYTTNGNVQAMGGGAPSVCSATAPPIPGWATWDIVTGTIGPGGPYTDPFAGTLPACTIGGMAGPMPVPVWTGGPACPGGSCYIPSGVYCGNNNVNLSSPDPCNCVHTAAGGATFITSGTINISGSGGGNLTAFGTGNPNRILLSTSSAATPAFNFGGCVGCGGFTFNGAIYVPRGYINMGTQDPMVINGSIVANEILLGLGTTGPFVITGNGAGGASTWSIYQ